MKKIITNISQIVTPVEKEFAAGKEMAELKIYENSSIIIEDGLIQEIVTDKTVNENDAEIINAKGAVILPAFVDPHTHIPFAGSRENEFNMRIQGKNYMDIAKKGGGINSTVRDTRTASEEQLYNQAAENLQRMIRHGVGTFEIKSGYGLDTETELKQLRVIKKLQDNFNVDIKATFLGAHEIPPEYKENKAAYIELVINEMLPAVKQQGIAEYCDIFCEKGVFEIEESHRILNEARKQGFKLRLHADEIVPLGGAELAAELKAVSADHLVQISPEGINKMAEAGTVFVLLPGTTFFLMLDKFAPAKEIIRKNGIIALSTDFNPGSSFTHSMPLIINLACLKMGMTIEETINAATINGAYSLGLADKTGSIHPGKQADFTFMDAANYQYLVYNFGVNRINAVMKKGKFIFNNIF